MSSYLNATQRLETPSQRRQPTSPGTAAAAAAGAYELQRGGAATGWRVLPSLHPPPRPPSVAGSHSGSHIAAHCRLTCMHARHTSMRAPMHLAAEAPHTYYAAWRRESTANTQDTQTTDTHRTSLLARVSPPAQSPGQPMIRSLKIDST